MDHSEKLKASHRQTISGGDGGVRGETKRWAGARLQGWELFLMAKWAQIRREQTLFRRIALWVSVLKRVYLGAKQRQNGSTWFIILI